MVGGLVAFRESLVGDEDDFGALSFGLLGIIIMAMASPGVTVVNVFHRILSASTFTAPNHSIRFNCDLEL